MTAQKSQASWGYMLWAEGCAHTRGHTCLLQRMRRCCWRAGRCLALPAQASSHPPPQLDSKDLLLSPGCAGVTAQQGDEQWQTCSLARLRPFSCSKSTHWGWGPQLCRAALRDHQGLLAAGASSSMKQLSLITIQFTTNRRGGSTTFSKTATKDACLS